MKLNIFPSDLLTGLNKVLPAVGKVDVTSCVHMQVQEDTLSLTCTDGEVVLSTDIEIDIADDNADGIVCVNAKMLCDVVKKLDKTKKICIKTNENDRVVITSGRFKNTLQMLDAELFPNIQLPTDALCSATFKTADLFAVIELTKNCVSADSYRAFLKGLNIVFFEDKIEVVSSNGYMMAFTKTSSGISNTDVTEIIIPKKTIDVISTLVKNAEEPTACLRVYKQAVSLDIDGVSMTSVLIDAKFPNVKPIIDFNADIRLIVDKDDFAESIKRVAVTANNVNKAVSLVVKGNELYIQSKNSKHEEAEDCITIESNTDLYETAFNSEYLLYVLSNLPDDKVCILLSKNSNNGKFVSYNEQQCATRTEELPDDHVIYTISRVVV